MASNGRKRGNTARAQIPAQREGVDSSYVSRIFNLATLAREIVAAILDETLPPDVTLFDLAVDPSALWEEHRGPDRLGN